MSTASRSASPPPATAPDAEDPEKSPGSPPDDTSKSYEVTFDYPASPLTPHPFTIPLWRKWLYVILVSASSLCVTCVSSIYTMTYSQLQAEWGASEILCTLGLSLFVMGLGIGPMVLAPLSEFYGRQPIYAISLLMFVIWIIPCAVAQNIETMLVARFFNGAAGSAFLSVAGGTVADLFPKSEIQLPMLMFTASPFIGPELGPLLGGFINQYTNWRWTFWVALIWAAVQWVLVVVLVPETYHPVLLRNKARKARKETGDESWYAPIEKHERSIAQVSSQSDSMLTNLTWSVVVRRY